MPTPRVLEFACQLRDLPPEQRLSCELPTYDYCSGEGDSRDDPEGPESSSPADGNRTRHHLR